MGDRSILGNLTSVVTDKGRFRNRFLAGAARLAFGERAQNGLVPVYSHGVSKTELANNV
jgi:hypothetical protein